MDKAAAAAFLGVSERTIERYVKDKKLGVSHVNGSPHYSDDELARFKKETGTPVYQPVVNPNETQPNEQQLSPRITPQHIDLGLEQLQAIADYYRLLKLGSKLLLSLEEAMILSGLPVSFLKKHIIWGDLKAKKLGKSWKVRKQDLEEFINQIYT